MLFNKLFGGHHHFIEQSVDASVLDLLDSFEKIVMLGAGTCEFGDGISDSFQDLKC